MDSYKIGLGNSDTATRKNAELDNISFWNDEAKKLSWFKPWTKVLEWNAPFAKWFVDGKINACLLYTSPSPRDRSVSRMPSSA